MYVDDATGNLMEFRFVEAESSFDYFAATRAFLARHGRPRLAAFYSDKHSIFRVARTDSSGRSGGMTQFGRALAAVSPPFREGGAPRRCAGDPGASVSTSRHGQVRGYRPARGAVDRSLREQLALVGHRIVAQKANAHRAGANPRTPALDRASSAAALEP